MNSTLNRRFVQIKGSNPEQGNYITLCMAVQYKGYDKKAIISAFKMFMEKNEYEKRDVDQLIDYLVFQTSKESQK